MKTKICGVCRPADAAVVAQAGADFVGVILAHKGPRQQSTESARAIFDAAPGVLRAGVFADQDVRDVVAAATLLHLDVIQLHGSESTHYIKQLASEVDGAIWKSVWLKTRADLDAVIDLYADHVDALHLDAATGGSGTMFDWSCASAARAVLPGNVALVVAGGLTPENVQEAVALLRPDIVDVASGVESAVGRKSARKIQEFLRNART